MAELKGNAMGYGYNIGVHLRANDNIQFGISYRSGVKMKVKNGAATFTVPSALASNFPYTSFKSDINLPQVVSVGIGVKVTERLGLQADANFVGWSSYDSLIFDYEKNTSALLDTRSPRRYKNTVILRVGGNYAIGNKWTAMLGAAYDQSPVRDGYLSPDLPDNNHIMATGGFVFKPNKKLAIMGVLEYVFTPVREGSLDEAQFSGRYQTKIFNPGIGLNYEF